MLDLLLKNGVIITVDREHHIYTHGYIGIQDDRIACLGAMDDTPVLPDAKTVIDLEGKPVLPGLVDGHGHAGHGMTRSICGNSADDWESAAESIYYMYSDEDFWYTEGALSAMERLKFGVTTAVSMVGNTPRVDDIWPIRAHMQGSLITGIRQYSGIGTANEPWPKTARTYHGLTYDEYTVTPDKALHTTEEALKQLNGRHPRGTCIVAPGRMGKRPGYSIEDNILHNRRMYELARMYDQPIHTHAYGGDVAFLNEYIPEVLDWHLSLTHSTGYSEAELDILAHSNTYVFHGPTTYSHIICRCPVTEMLERGIHVAVITDGSAPDRSFDLWRDMKNVQILQRYEQSDYSLLPCGKVLEMVTIEPARALGIDHLVGSLETGKKADLIRINTKQPHLTPFIHMPVERLVQFAMGQDVDLVITDGRIRMEGRTLTDVSEEKILQDAEEVFERTMKRFGRTDIFEDPGLYDLRH